LRFFYSFSLGHTHAFLSHPSWTYEKFTIGKKTCEEKEFRSLFPHSHRFTIIHYPSKDRAWVKNGTLGTPKYHVWWDMYKEMVTEYPECDVVETAYAPIPS